MSKIYKCSFTPTGPYFFGGEKIFDFEGSNNYYITSLREPSQSTILGSIRFLVLKKAGKLSPENGDVSVDLISQQEELVGKNGNVVERDCSYGKIKKLSPIFIGDEGNVYVKTPLNHKTEKQDDDFDDQKKKAEVYQPFKMEEGFVSEKGETILPVDYVAKDYLTDSYLNLENKTLISSYDLFCGQEQTHIARKRDDKGKLVMSENAYFKKKYYLLKPGFSFVVYVECEDDILPDKELAFMGQEKSAFYFWKEECTEIEFNKIEDKIKGLYSSPEGYHAYYVESDSYFKDYKEFNRLLSYSINNKRTYRFLTDVRGAKSFKERIEKSKSLYQFIEKGSVLFVKNENDSAFKELLKMNESMKLSGFNFLVEF